MDRKSCCTTPRVSVGSGVGVSKILKFYVKVFYVMGKVLSGELSCVWTSHVVLGILHMAFIVLLYTLITHSK